jgi:hypothetical protein
MNPVITCRRASDIPTASKIVVNRMIEAAPIAEHTYPPLPPASDVPPDHHAGDR